MVEVLILVALIIGIRAVYLRIFRGQEEAKGFVEKSTSEVNKAMGNLAVIFLIAFGLIVFLIALLAS